MAEAKQRFPADMDYAVSLDQTLSVTEGMHEIVKTLFEALALVILVVFIFLQGLARHADSASARFRSR